MADEIQIFHPKRVRNRFHHVAGLGLLAANYLRHRVRAYRPRRLRPTVEPERAYCRDDLVVDGWLHHLERYLGKPASLAGRSALEIGPGPDLGTGLILLARGLASYLAIDVQPLLRQSPRYFHLRLAELIAKDRGVDADELTGEVTSMLEGEGRRLRYLAQTKIDLRVLEEDSVDYVFSQAAFEHLDHVDRTVQGLSRIAKPGAVIVTEVDLATHSRWIGDEDPLNIYRYAESLYNSLWFDGLPNRVRPDHYVEALLRHGWEYPRFYPRRVLEPRYVKRVAPSLAQPFRNDLEQLGWLSVVICATRGEESPE